MSIEWMMPSNYLIFCCPLFLLPSIFPSSRVFSNELESGGQSTGASASASVLPKDIQSWFPLGLTGLISLLSVQFNSVAQSCPTLCDPMNRSTPGLRSSLRLTSIESVMPSSHLNLCRPLLLLPPIPPSVRVFSNESTLLMRWPKYWSFSFSIIPSKEIPRPISFRMDWLDLLAVQGTLKSLIQLALCKVLIFKIHNYLIIY